MYQDLLEIIIEWVWCSWSSYLLVFLHKFWLGIVLFLNVLFESFSVNWFENVKWTTQGLVNVKNACIIVKLSAVVRSWKNSYKSSVCHEFVAVYHYLMRPADEVQLVALVKLLDDVVAKHITYSSVVVSPTLNVVLWIRPKEVTKQSCVWHFLGPILSVYYF